MPKVTIAQNILAVNEHVAQEIRQSLSAQGIRALNVMSSPGAGKTTLLERTIDRLRGQLGIGVIEGDVETSADAERIEAAGAEPFVADPDRVATLVPALDHVAVVCVLLGSAGGPDLHASRLEMLLARLIDTTIRGVVYETPADEEASGAEIVRRACERSQIPYSLLEVDTADHGTWLAAAVGASERLLE